MERQPAKARELKVSASFVVGFLLGADGTRTAKITKVHVWTEGIATEEAKLPDDCKVEQIVPDFIQPMFHILVSSESFPEVPVGKPYPEMMPVLTTINSQD